MTFAEMPTFETWIQIATALATVGAVIVGIWATTTSNKNNIRIMKIGKIEEMYEICSSLFFYYDVLFTAYNKYTFWNNPDISAEDKKRLWNEYEDYVKRFREATNVELLSQKAIRLKVLASAYIDGDVKLEAIAYSELFGNIIIASLYRGGIPSPYDDGYPETHVVHDYLQDLQAKFVNEIEKK